MAAAGERGAISAADGGEKVGKEGGGRKGSVERGILFLSLLRILP